MDTGALVHPRLIVAAGSTYIDVINKDFHLEIYNK